MDVLRSLRGSGVAVDQLDVEPRGSWDSHVDAVIAVAGGASKVRFAVEEKRRAPYPNELTRLEARREVLSGYGHPLLVVPFVSEVLGVALTETGWSWADPVGNFDLRARGLVLRQRRTTVRPRSKAKSLPRGSGSLGIVRTLIGLGRGEEEEAGATVLAAEAGVSQPRASQVLRQLADLQLVEKTERGRWRPDREALLDRFLAEYAGPQGSEQHFYSLDTPTDVAVLAARASTQRRRIAISADVGPDLLLAWRRPSVVIVYATRDIETAELNVVVAQGRDDANVIVRVPDDRSVFPIPELVAAVGDAEVPLADTAQMIWDLQDLEGADRLEAAGMLREWLLKRP